MYQIVVFVTQAYLEAINIPSDVQRVNVVGMDSGLAIIRRASHTPLVGGSYGLL